MVDDCIIWQGYIRKDGYPDHLVYRRRYERVHGPVPDGLELDHLCRNPKCVNPEHLEPVTHAENLRRGRSAKREKTHCPHGHPYSGVNLRIDKYGARVCRICDRAKTARYKKRKIVW